jgi:hypothetical protein
MVLAAQAGAVASELSAVGALVRAIDTVLDPIAEAGHGDTQLSAQAIVLIRLASLGLTLWTDLRGLIRAIWAVSLTITPPAL